MTNKYPTNWFDIRKKIIERDGGKCYYCTSAEGLMVHHQRPLSMGGNSEPYNLITLCRDCHVEEHKFIRESGLCTIPGPYFEPYRFYLTDKEAVLRYADQLESEGLDPAYIRSLYA